MIAPTFIRRPVTTTLAMAAVLIFGYFAYRQLPVNDLPNVDFPTITVSANVPGASPETMATAVATPLEKQFSTIQGVESMNSTSSQGSTQITITFDLSRNIDAAAQDVQAAIAKTLRELPADMPSPPSYQKVNPADSPILYMALSSPTLQLSQVDEYAQTIIAQRLSTVPGVAQVQVFGSQKYAVRVQLDPRALAARRIGIDEVAQAIRSGNVNMPTGTLFGQHQAYTIRSSGQLSTADQFRPLIVAYREGAPVRLEEVGQVLDSVENDKTAGWYAARVTTPQWPKGDRAIVLAVQRQPGTNTIEVVDRIRALLPALEAQLPSAVQLRIHFDRSLSIRESVDEVKFHLMLAIALVVLVIFLFLRNVSATIIPSLAVPMSIVGTFAVMYQLGFSVNLLSLMALTLCVGFVVDDAIVMLENIVRHLEMGKPPFKAAMDGAREITFTIVSMTLSLVAVFIPVVFMGGILGRLLNEFAITISAAILVSGFVSLTLTPMLCSKFLRHTPREKHGRFYRSSERVFDGMLRGYQWSLAGVMRHRALTMLVTALVVVATVYLFQRIPKGFLPAEDTGGVFVLTEAAQGISAWEMQEKQQQVAEVIGGHPAVAGYMSFAGGSNTGRMFVRFRPIEERVGAEQIVQDLRPQLARITGINTFMQILPPIRIGGRLTQSEYQFALQSPDTEELYAAATELEARLRELPILQDVTSDLQMHNPQVNVDIDRDKASALGITTFQIEDALYSAYGSRQVSTILAPTNQYRVIMELLPDFQRDPAALAMLYIRSSKGELVPLNAVANLRRSLGPLSVNHVGQTAAVTLSFNLRPGVALSEATEAVNAVALRTVPASVITSFQGTAAAFEDSVRGLGILLIMAILVIYIVLGILYESFIHPITILSGLPAAGVGALLTLMAFGYELNLYGFVGILLLVGIVKKNAIMMIDFALAAQRDEGKSPAESIYQGALVRFRPIMMTTVSTLAAVTPIALAVGSMAGSRRPLGLAVVGGLALSQILTLYITPVIYLYLEGFQRRTAGLFRRRKPTPVAAHAERELAMAGHEPKQGD